jgi:hypothetical protein
LDTIQILVFWLSIGVKICQSFKFGSPDLELDTKEENSTQKKIYWLIQCKRGQKQCKHHIWLWKCNLFKKPINTKLWKTQFSYSLLLRSWSPMISQAQWSSIEKIGK